MKKRPIEKRPQPCVICGKTVAIRSTISPHPEAPEMLSFPVGAWVGFVTGDTTTEMIVTCCEAHTMQLLEEG